MNPLTRLKTIRPLHVLSNFSNGEQGEGLLVSRGGVGRLQVGGELRDDVVRVARRLRHDEGSDAFCNGGASLKMAFNRPDFQGASRTSLLVPSLRSQAQLRI